MDRQEAGCRGMDWIELAQDRDRWRAQNRSCQQPVNITRDCTNCYLYRVDPPDDEQQAYLKHVEAYYLNKLTEKECNLLVHVICPNHTFV
jgi:hypothetical protein